MSARPPFTIRHNLPILLLAACQARAGDSGPGAREFKGTTAFSYVEKQMSYGPRIPNTPGHDKMGDWLLAELRARADTVIVQDFQQRTSKGQTLNLPNFSPPFRPQPPDPTLFLPHS